MVAASCKLRKLKTHFRRLIPLTQVCKKLLIRGFKAPKMLTLTSSKCFVPGGLLRMKRWPLITARKWDRSSTTPNFRCMNKILRMRSIWCSLAAFWRPRKSWISDPAWRCPHLRLISWPKRSRVSPETRPSSSRSTRDCVAKLYRVTNHKPRITAKSCEKSSITPNFRSMHRTLKTRFICFSLFEISYKTVSKGDR